MSYYSSYRWCAVPECKNTSVKTPEKLWVRVPNDLKIRKTWFEVARRDLKLIHSKTRLYFCEDHFDLEHDMENYVKYKVMGSVKWIRLRPNCIPSRFNCNKKHKSASNECRLAEAKRLKISKDSIQDHIEDDIVKASSSCIEEQIKKEFLEQEEGSDWVEYVGVKQEWKEEEGSDREDAGACGVSEAAARSGLYAGHEVKDELVLGPEGIQPYDVTLPVQIKEELLIEAEESGSEEESRS